MRKLSVWARQNPWKARIIIVFSHLLILSLAVYAGTTLRDLDVTLPGSLFLLCMLWYFLAVGFYPAKKHSTVIKKHLYYVRQKACDFSLTVAAFGMLLCVANSPARYFHGANSALGVVAFERNLQQGEPTAAQILASLKSGEKTSLTSAEKKILRNEFKIQAKRYVSARLKGKRDDGSDALIVILAIIAALGLAYLVAALACNLSCNGNDGAAVLVIILGGAAIGLGLYYVFRGLKRRKQKDAILSPEFRNFD